MSGDQVASTIFVALILLLVLSSLVARRVPAASYLRMGLLWAVIVAVISAVIWLLY